MAHGYNASNKSNKSGADYWKKRSHNRRRLGSVWMAPVPMSSGKWVKKLTHRLERKCYNEIIEEDLFELY